MKQGILKQKGVKSKLRDLLLFTFLIFWANIFSQGIPPPPPPLEIGAVTTGYYKCYVDGKYIDQHYDEKKAVTHCATLSAINPDVLVGFTHPDFTEITVTGYKTIEVDTVQLVRVKDLKGWIDATTHPHDVWLPFYNEGVIGFKSDTVYNWQSKYNFKRTKTFGKVSYENLDVPFQFADVWSVDQAVYFITTEKPVRMTCFINDEKFKEFIPGHSDKVENGWEFYWGVPSSGEMIVEIENDKGDVIIYKTTLKL